MFRKHEANSQENHNAEVHSRQKPLHNLKSHPHTDRAPKIRSTITKHPFLGQHLWGTASACPKKFKRLNLYQVFIYNCITEIYKNSK